MRKIAAWLTAVVVTASASQGAMVYYSLSGSSLNGTVVSGSFSFDSTVIGPNYNGLTALDDLTTFSVTLSSIPGAGPSSTSFSKGVDTSSVFVISTDGAGEITDFSPEFDENADGYSMQQGGVNTTLLLHDLEPFGADSITWSFTQVPEVGEASVAVALGLLGFLGFRRWRRGVAATA